MKVLKEKMNEAFSSVLPITVIVLLLSTFFAPVPTGTVVMFLFGAFLLVVGMGFFSLGADMAMMPMGEGIGVEFTKAKKLWLIVLMVLSMGIFITVAEPDLQVLARQVTSIPGIVLIMAVAVGVGIFLAISVLRVLFRISLTNILIVCYILALVLSFFSSNDFVPVAFDSGGVTTGPITVPFILALGLGISSVRSDKNSQEDSFGFVALCSIGPILAVLILGIVYNTSDTSYTPHVIAEVLTTRDVTKEFASGFPVFIHEVFLALVPIVFFFGIFQLITRRYKKRQLSRMAVGFVYTIIGLILFLTGVNVGFIPMGYLIGSEIAGSALKWLLVPIGMIFGYFIVVAEPAVHVLNKQVEQVSGGAIPAKAMNRCLSLGVAASVGLSIFRILAGINLFWFLIPGLIVALVLTFFVPKIFSGIAFDSGGVASGPMTSTFLLPFAIGVCSAVGGNVMTDAFGIVAMVATTPLIAIQILGVVYGNKMKASARDEERDITASKPVTEETSEIVSYDEEIISYEEENLNA